LCHAKKEEDLHHQEDVQARRRKGGAHLPLKEIIEGGSFHHGGA
jgi:hypothetical protein